MEKKRGFLFTLDSVLGVSLLLLGILVFSLFFVSDEETTQSSYISQDTTDFLGELKVGDLPPDLQAYLRNASDTTDPELSVLEQIAFYHVKNEPAMARNLSRGILRRLVPQQFGYSIIVGGDEVYRSGLQVESTLVSSRKMVSGIEKNRPIKGFLSYAYLIGLDVVNIKTYTYFGGFIGQGNVTVPMELPPYLNVTGILIEGVFSRNFSLLINGMDAGDYLTSGPGLTATVISLDPSNFSLLYPGAANNFSFRFDHLPDEELGYIGGGFISVSSNVSTNESAIHGQGFKQFTRIDNTTVITTTHFPQIEGFPNVYSSQFLPPELNNITGRLHYFADWGELENASLRFTMGNLTIYEDRNLTGDEEIALDASDFAGVLASLNRTIGQTVPYRFGLTSLNISGNETHASLITDLSGSMSNAMNGGGGIPRECNDTLLFDPGTRRLSVAKCLDKEFVSTFLPPGTKNLISLVAYEAAVWDYLPLTQDKPLLNATIDDYTYLGTTCISCGVRQSVLSLTDTVTLVSNSSVWKFFDRPNPFPPFWKNVSYDDSFWTESQAPFGVGYTVNTPLIPGLKIANAISRGVDHYYNDSGRETFVGTINLMDGIASAFQNVTVMVVENSSVGDSRLPGEEEYSGFTSVHNASPAAYSYLFPWSCEKVFLFTYNFGSSSGNPGVIPNCKDQITIYRKSINPGDPAGYHYKQIWKKNTKNQFCNFGNGPNSYLPNASGEFNPSIPRLQEGDILSYYSNHSSILTTYRDGNRRLVLDGIPDEAYDWNEENSRRTSISANCTCYWRPRVIVTLNSTPFPDLDYGLLNVSVVMSTQIMGRNVSVLLFNWSSESWVPTCEFQTFGVLTRHICTTDNPSDFFGPGNVVRARLFMINNTRLYVDQVNFTAVAYEGNTYFRKHFTLPRLDLLNVSLYLMSDQMAEVFLNNRTILNETVPHQGSVWNQVVAIPDGMLNSSGDNVLAVHMKSKHNRSFVFDAQLTAGGLSNSTVPRSMLIMSDGEANVLYGGSWPGTLLTLMNGSPYTCSACNQTVAYACDAFRNKGIHIYSVSFANTSEVGKSTLYRAACCENCSHFYSSQDSAELFEIYRRIAEEMGSLVFITQSAMLSGNLSGILYNDSFLEFNSTMNAADPSANLIPVTVQSAPFGNTDTQGTFYFSSNDSILDARVTSYSGDRWTDLVTINAANKNVSIFNLSSYGDDYQLFGDPFILEVNPHLIQTGLNTFRIETGYSAANRTGGSPDDRFIYTALISSSASSEGIGDYATGCVWTIESEDGAFIVVTLPDDYSGSRGCSYTNTNYTNSTHAFDPHNAIDMAVANLLHQLDIDADGRVDINIQENNLGVTSTTTKDIPYLWGPTLVEVRVWH
ncbi:MAG: hypothetical protein V1735_07830 [Nanoarchaeota archaeon]